MKNKPFAMLGVNAGLRKPGQLRKAMATHLINWRTFDDDGAIIEQWNHPVTPSFVVLDHKGTIRHRWAGNPGNQTMDKVLGKLIEEAGDKQH